MSEPAALEGVWEDLDTRARLRYRLWRPLPARALLVLLHGFNEHGGRYDRIAKTLAEQGICVAVPDLWGHGRSDGRRGDVPRVADCVTRLLAMTTQAFLPKSGLSHYALFGHSFGGLMAIEWARRDPAALRRVTITSPFLDAAFSVPIWKQLAASLLGACWPIATLPLSLNPNHLSRDPAVVASYRADTLIHNAISARTYGYIRQAQADARAGAADCRRPLQMMCGDADRIASIQAAKLWYQELTCEKSVMVFPDAYHEIQHEPEVKDEVVRRLRDWTLADA